MADKERNFRGAALATRSIYPPLVTRDNPRSVKLARARSAGSAPRHLSNAPTVFPSPTHNVYTRYTRLSHTHVSLTFPTEKMAEPKQHCARGQSLTSMARIAIFIPPRGSSDPVDFVAIFPGTHRAASLSRRATNNRRPPRTRLNRRWASPSRPL